MGRGIARELLHAGTHALVSRLQADEKEGRSCPAPSALEPVDYRLIGELCGRRDECVGREVVVCVAALCLTVGVLGLLCSRGPRCRGDARKHRRGGAGILVR